MTSVITLLTDFGDQDGYVGVMKGIMIDICPEARFIDLSHRIPPQNLGAARFTLLNAYPFFPDGTIHLVVVDPGVGTARRAIAVQTPRGYLVGPDNGVFSGILDQETEVAAVALTQTHYWRTAKPSTTFHGRDIFAPVAAHLAAGVALTELGEAVDPASLVRLALPQPTITASEAVGNVQHIDQFGNLITTIPATAVRSSVHKVLIGAVEIPWGQTYGEVAIGQAIALIGSHGWVEIAVNGSSASDRLRLSIGDTIRLEFQA